MNSTFKTSKNVKKPPKRTPLSQNEVNQLLSLLCSYSNNHQIIVTTAKKVRSKVWQSCDKERKDDPEVARNFEFLKVVNTAINKLTKQHKLLAGTISKLKTHR